MDFQLILYIIIVIVWLVLDNYRRIKKKQEYQERKSTTSAPRTETREKPYTTLEDILKEFGMEEEPEPVVERKPRPVKKQEKAIPATPKYETYESNIDKNYKFSSETWKKDVKPLGSIPDLIRQTEIKEPEKRRKGGEKEDFDLRTAIIWSEILKRPHA
jgi:FtsZ-interacting cell division protein ZipA